jgi:DNA-binding response OmpR family regulator
LVLNGAIVSTFSSAKDFWDRFQNRPARMVITDRKFDDDFGGKDLVRLICQNYKQPYVYLLILSRMGQLKETKVGFALGVDDYLLFPHNPFQIRSRVLVAMRWLSYIDSVTINK